MNTLAVQNMESKKHIVVIAFPGYGHLIPLLSFARKAAEHHHVTFVISKCKLNDLRTRELFTAEDEKTIALIGLEDGIPDGAGEDTNPSVWGMLWDGIIPSIEAFLRTVPTPNKPSSQSPYSITRPVDVVFCELFLACSAVICQQRGIPCYLFCTARLGAQLSRLNVTEHTPVVAEGEVSPLRHVMGKRAMDPEQKNAPFLDRHKKHSLSICSGLKPAVGIVINSFREIEEEAIAEYLKDERAKGHDVKCTGPLLPEEDKLNSQNFKIQQQVQQWLDTKPPNSVIYIAFGSVRIPAKERITEIGKALLLLNQPFIFSLRQEQHDLLPEEIRRGMADQFAGSALGLVLPWAPQRNILLHPATGVFLSHCGWNSTVEAMYTGTPVLSWPIFGDQLYNGQLLEEAGMGVVLINADEHVKIVPAEEIAEKLANVGGFAFKGRERVLDTGFKRAAEVWKEKTRAAVTMGGSSEEEFEMLMALEVLRKSDHI
ncbi:uncharacterized protein LOC129587490 [Paramacrobiotus metropolitanus]|uniref:uncharacterized protein LOC129587490 n=1 Tax=Paramacrobiotus metropolitanus TaxID=2943436 RepID=UPI002445E289|nr:uncharacterized protein LOC129587490 [Paramacrobiotus metropolitanus]